MPLFGEKGDRRTAEDQAARAVFDWAIHLPPGDLAAELMTAFGTENDGLSDYDLVNWLLSSVRPQSVVDMPFYSELTRLIDEAVQLLEHAELICLAGTVQTWLRYRPTHLGLGMVANGKAVVRQRIKDRTGL